MYRYSSFESHSGGIPHVPRRLGYRGCVSIATVPYGGTGMTRWQAVVAERCGDPSIPLFALSPLYKHTYTHTDRHDTRGSLGENFCRAARRWRNSYDGGKVWARQLSNVLYRSAIPRYRPASTTLIVPLPRRENARNQAGRASTLMQFACPL